MLSGKGWDADAGQGGALCFGHKVWDRLLHSGQCVRTASREMGVDAGRPAVSRVPAKGPPLVRPETPPKNRGLERRRSGQQTFVNVGPRNGGRMAEAVDARYRRRRRFERLVAENTPVKARRTPLDWDGRFSPENG